ncbi:serine/threonine protein kinase [Bacillus sp. FJAT-45350]|uniref:serine/threonine protein kinase n=1 Tax=Bacillus sp. FJAT-45350 TaxID=2011014 RepID=UPI000BB973D9|nr:protein kinase family protein [Bacillus sp. FJAT-45350]
MFTSSKKWLGKTIKNYTILQKLGEGRYGVTYLATTPQDEIVVIKRFKPLMFKLNKKKNAYEAVLLSQIDHSGIPKMLGVINVKGFYGFVLEYIPGTTIEKVIFQQNYQFTNSEIFHIGIQLIQIIKYLHHLGIVHRDIRIPNVLLNNNKVSLIDFGLARWIDNEEYTFEQDFSYLGDFLLYLHYSSFHKNEKYNRPWYEELDLSDPQIQCYKKLLRLAPPYTTINQVEKDFLKVWGR